MSRYVFICEPCNLEVEFTRSIHEGPPKEGSDERKCPECEKEMWHDIGCAFILKGSWPGKDLTRQNEGTTTAEKAEKYFDEHNIARKEGDEVLAERRKGTESFKKFEKTNRAKVKRYWDNRTKGITKPK